MKTVLEKINLEQESVSISKFITTLLQRAKKKKVIIGLSGGIDSATVLYLLRKSVPPEQVVAAHLSYFQNDETRSLIKTMLQKHNIPEKQQFFLSIKQAVDTCASDLLGETQENQQKIRLGNIMARIRMIYLYDLAKRFDGLVCGTENKTEHLLGYYTRFGDAASDFEPIRHLYKTQVYMLAADLQVPEEVLKRKPTADLWEEQTDEGEFGFSYTEADAVLHLYYDLHEPLHVIEQKGFPNAKQIIAFGEKNKFKNETPYMLLDALRVQ